MSAVFFVFNSQMIPNELNYVQNMYLRGRYFISIRFWYDDVYIEWWQVLKHTKVTFALGVE